MKTITTGYRGYRFPREIISLCVWLYHRFALSFRDVEELLAERGVFFTYETVRQWCMRSYSAAQREVLPSVAHDTGQYANNRAEVSHQPTRQRERLMRGFKSVGQAQRFLSVHGVVQNLLRLGRHLLLAAHYRMLRDRSFNEWSAATGG